MIGLLVSAAVMSSGRDVMVPAFHRVDLATKATVRIEQGSPWHIAIGGDPRVTRCVTSEVTNGTLVLGWSKQRRIATARSEASENAIVVNGRAACRRPNGPESLSIQVSAPAIDGVTLSDHGTISVAAMEVPFFSVSIPGNGDVALDRLQVGATHFSVDGRGRITASGDVGALEIDIAGSGAIDTRGASARSIGLDIGGHGDVAATVDGRVSGNLGGTGTIAIAGKPVCAIQKLGRGHILCLAGSL